MRSSQRNTQPAALTGLQATDVPLRVLVSEPDPTSRSLICALLKSNPESTVICVEDSQLLSTIDELAPDLVIVDVHSPSIRGVPNWEGLGVQPTPAKIVTGFDPSAVSRFASNAVDFLVKPFDVDRLGSALDLAAAVIGKARKATAPTESSSHAGQGAVQGRFVQRLAVEAGEKIVLLRTDNIEWLQASGNNIRIHMGEMVYLLSACASKCDR